MLNISNQKVSHRVKQERYPSFQSVLHFKSAKMLTRFLLVLLVVILILMFLPWTQNIQSDGVVTSLQPEQRPQTIHAIIPGAIQKWYVREGDLVQKGDTILELSEIKPEYMDPALLERTQEQIYSKENAIESYGQKVMALDSQVVALEQNRKLKLQQAENKITQGRLKVQADSADYQAAITNYEIADSQFARQQKLYDKGLKSLTELERRRQKLRETEAKVISANNKWITSQNELLNARMEFNRIKQEFREKIAKTRSDRFATESNLYEAEATLTKMRNQLSNYETRSGYYFVRAPQNGYITKAVKTGIGETVKEGEPIITVMPASYQLAVETYVKPIDLPLVKVGQVVRIQFDGWPAIVFSGWPTASYGTFEGKVVAIDNFASIKGKYRILIAPDDSSYPWPNGLRVGSGATTMALLSDVPVWYEIWRQLNGFPPDYYKNLSVSPDTKISEK